MEPSPAITLLHSPLIPNNFFHGFPTRFGGVSKNTFSSLNLYFSKMKEDSEENVRINTERLANHVSMPLQSLVVTRCVHENNVHVVTERLNEALPDHYDAVVTNIPGTWVGALHADCIPVLLADPSKMVCAAVHSGWGGTLLDVVGATVQTLVSTFKSSPSDIVAAIGPAIGPCCFEVGPEVVSKFEEKYVGVEGLVVDGPCKKHINLQAAIKSSLIAHGISPDKIDTSNNYCTKCDPKNRFFSYRRDGIQFGSHLSFIGIPERKFDGVEI